MVRVSKKTIDQLLSILCALTILLFFSSAFLYAHEETMIEISFQNALIADVFHILEGLSGFTIILHPSITGRISVHLDSTPFLSSLSTITEKLGYDFLRAGSTFFVAPPNKLDEMLKKEEIRLFSIRSIPIEKIQSALSLHLPTIEQFAQVEWNTILLKGRPADLDRAAILINRLDEEKYIEQDFLYYPILYGEEEKIVSLLSSSLPNLRIEVDQRAQSLIARGLPEDLLRAEKLLVDLDRKITDEWEVQTPFKEGIDGAYLSSLLKTLFPSLHIVIFDREEKILWKGHREEIRDALQLFSLLEEKLLAKEEVKIYGLQHIEPDEMLAKLYLLPSVLLPEIEAHGTTLLLSGSKNRLRQVFPLLKELDDAQGKDIQYISIKEIGALQMAQILEELALNVSVQVDDLRNALYIIGTEDELQAAQTIISRRDREQREMVVYSLQHIQASQLTPFLRKLIPSLTIIGERSNLLSLQGYPKDIEKVSEWIKDLDQEDFTHKEITILSLHHDYGERYTSLLPSIVPNLSVVERDNILLAIGSPSQIEKARDWLAWLDVDVAQDIDTSLFLVGQEIPLTVTGIVVRDRENLAIIESGEASYILRAGDSFEQFVVLEIYQESVLLRDESGQVFSLLLGGLN